jgi:hypothetical protein
MEYKYSFSNAANSNDTILASVMLADDAIGQITLMDRSFALPNLDPLFQAIADFDASADSASTLDLLGTLSVVFCVDDVDFLPSLFHCGIPEIIVEFLSPGHSPDD